MAFADTQTITVDSAAVPMPRIFTSTGVGQFTSANGDVQLEVAPKNGKSTKGRTIRLRVSKVTSDPLVATTNVRVQDLISLTIVRPNDGFSDAEILKHVKGLFGLLTASTDAALIKLIAGEN